MQAQAKPVSSDTQIVAKAIIHIKDELGLSFSEVGKIIGADPATVSRISKKQDMQNNKVFEASVLLIRAYRSLYAILGGTQEAMIHWLKTANKDFAMQAPLTHMQGLVGLVETVQYLDAMRGRA